ncbi:alanine/glycine:cation symporter family protein [Cryobacterium psychrophilum]|uniref:Alanine:cation symporter family protein n=1 Tax=Cryobacterium psychrophilum TaxID=41988 RepID=A0A4Y8KIU4_9MICO|nr:alanine/glycine:cation symporter family protein [Cryobacterium psychrophilum]TDW29220.1 AGCS family alanine or glycine:cation symporter [Cryobacterium psychrophilum]TFD74665.1 alanine:cation symporter family protein [Cryobacterium psychrophilum]
MITTGVDDVISDAFTPIADFISGIIFYSIEIGDPESTAYMKIPIIVMWLVIAALFFTIYLKFQNVRGIKHAINLVRGRYSKPEDAGEVSHFQALTTAISGTVGLGNIAGVAVAVSIGGPGATFWMILVGFLSMSTKMAECTLGVKYRMTHADGSVSGGPMYYLRDGLASLGKRKLGRVLAVLFSLFAIGGAIGGGNMFQANQATSQIINVTGGDDGPLGQWRFVIGLVFALAVGAVIIGGIKSIAKVTEKIVPLMAAMYILACLAVIFTNFTAIPDAIGQIFVGAFNPEGIAGGVVGVLIQGFQRAAFSNEAGVGSASIAHSAVKTEEPATEGFVALLEPFIDTVVICTMTALAIIITGTWRGTSSAPGVETTSAAFATVAPWFPILLAVAVVLFAFSTMISWSYYGMKATGYLFKDSARAELGFKIGFCVFTVIGATLSLGPVIAFSDAMIFAMAIPNVLGLYLMARVIRKEIFVYRSKVESGEFAMVEK